MKPTRMLPEKQTKRVVARWPTLLRIGLFLVASVVVLIAATPLARASAPLRPELVIGASTSVVTFGLTLLFVRWSRLRLGDVGALPRWSSLGRMCIGFVIGAGIVACHTAILAATGLVRWSREPGTDAAYILTMLAVFVLLACREELAFRGYPLQVAHRVIGVWGAQLLIALIFALEHAAGGATWANALLGAGVGSLLFGMAAIATRGLAVPIGLHAAYNFCDWLRGGKGGGAWSMIVRRGFESRAEVVAMAAYVALMLAGMLAFWWWYRSHPPADDRP